MHVSHYTFTYIVVWWTVWAPQMIWQPDPSIPLSFQMVLSYVSAAVAWAILPRISGLDPSSAMIAHGYLKLLTQCSFSPFTLVSVLMPLMLLVISLIFSALMCMLKAVEVLSRRSTKSASSSSLPARPSMSSAKR